MFASTFVVIAMLATSCAAALLCAVQAFRSRQLPQRADAGARILVAGSLALTALGWSTPWAPGMLLAAALLWSLARTAWFRQHRETGAAMALFRSATALLAGWVVLSVARAGASAAAHPAHQLGIILVDLLAAAIMAIAAAGWLLGTFATPATDGARSLTALTGTTEALLSLSLAVALYAIS